MASLAQDPVLVLGAPRSGTTYLRQILDAHHQMVMSNEIRQFTWLHRAYAELTSDHVALLNEREEFLGHLRLRLAALVRDYYAERHPEAVLWGDKNPHYAEDPAIVATAAELFPGLRIVHIHRDPRAVVASLLRKRHADGSPWVELERAHEIVFGHVRNALALQDGPLAAQVYRLSHEELVADDEAVASRLFDWLGLPIDAAARALCREQAAQRTSFSGPTSDLAEAGSRDAAIAGWKAVVPAERWGESLGYLAHPLVSLGYETEESLADLASALTR